MREPELLKAFMTAWESVTNAATLLPGGLHESYADRDNIPNTGTDEPSITTYGILIVKESAIARMTNGGVVREHIVQVDLKGYIGQIALMAVQEAMANTTSGVPSKLPSHTNLDNGGGIVDLWPAVASPERSSNGKQTRPISVVTVAWRVQSGWAY